jgi:hypothetical protein
VVLIKGSLERRNCFLEVDPEFDWILLMLASKIITNACMLEVLLDFVMLDGFLDMI